MHSDTLADTLIRLKNAAAVKKATVTVPATKMNLAVINLLLKENYIESFAQDENSKFPTLIVKLKYVGGSSALAHVKKISKPGIRIYSKATELKRTLSGYGIKIVSTSHGLMTDADARKNKLGGEVLAELW